MKSIVYIDRLTGKTEEEKVYGEKALKFLYGDDCVSKVFGTPLLHLLCRYPFFSAAYGLWQKSPFSRRKVLPFIHRFGLDSSEFEKAPSDFHSFNDFFIRKLKPACRPIVQDPLAAVIPADGRYLFYQKINEASEWIVKGESFPLGQLLGDAALARRYAGGSMVMARLCPVDYHRYHFPCDGIPGPSQLINGRLYSVNPLAVKKNFSVYTQNKRTLCIIETDHFGEVLFMEVGATNVGSINQTYQPNVHQSKGAEKGFFAFGGSALILLFEPQRVVLDQDLIQATRQGVEIRCLMGQSMGAAV